MSDGSSFRRRASLLAVLYLCAAGAGFVMMWSSDQLDDYAGWIPAVVAVQAGWCAILGRPAAAIDPWRAMLLGGFARLLMIVCGLAAVGALAERFWWWILVCLVFVLTPTVGAACSRRRPARPWGDTLTVHVRLLAGISTAAIGGGAIALACLVTTGDGMLAGLGAALALVANLIVLGFTLGPWLWTLTQERPPEVAVPVARVVER